MDLKNINIELYQACAAKRMKKGEIAKLAGIESSRFSRILHNKRKVKPDERRKLSKILGVSQKKLFKGGI